MDSMILLVAMIAVFYFIIIRPENKRKKQAETMRNSLKKGERITTIGGMVGRIVQVNDTPVVFETSEDRVRVEIAKWGIQSTESMEAAAQKSSKKSKKGEEKKEEAPAVEAEQPKVVEAPVEKEDKSSYDPEIKKGKKENGISKPPLAYAHVGECGGGFFCGTDGINGLVCEKMRAGHVCMLCSRICAAGADGGTDAWRRDRRGKNRRGDACFCGDRGLCRVQRGE